MKRCASCSASMKDDRMTCPRCGAPVSAPTAASTTIVAESAPHHPDSKRSSPNATRKPAAPKPPKPSIVPWVIVISLMVAILLVLVFRRP